MRFVRVRVDAEVPIGHAICVEALQSMFAAVEVAALVPAPYLYSATVIELVAAPVPMDRTENGVVDPIPTYWLVPINIEEVPMRLFVPWK